MISYRYHLISIIAIFLAIALGVVIGTSALNGAVVNDLHHQVSELKKSNDDMANQNKSLQAKVGNADLLAQTFGPKVSSHALVRTPIVLLGAPGASKEMKDAISTQVVTGGGKVVARIQLTKDIADPKRANDIRSLATSGAHPLGLQLPATTDPGTLAGALLGFVLLGHGQPTDLTQVLAGFATLKMSGTESGSVAAGKALLIVAPGGLDDSSPAAQTLLSMTTELGAHGGPTVVVGDAASADDGGLIALVRGDDSAKKAVSSVDDATTPLGRLTVVLAAAEASAGRKGHFGTATGADALVPNAVQ
jgi:hypothetical protein